MACQPAFINSGPAKLTMALVRRFKLLLEGFDVKLIVVPRPSQHRLKMSLEPIQFRLAQVSVAIDRPLQSPRPGPVIIINYGVVNLLALGIKELGRDKLPGIMHWPLAFVPGAVVAWN